MTIRLVLSFLLSASLSFPIFVESEEPAPPEFDSGRPRPPKAGFPVMGVGLALSHGYYRGVPRGEQSGWTVSLWFQANSEAKGEIFNIVLDEKSGSAVRLVHESGGLTLRGPGRRNQPDWTLPTKANAVSSGKWQHVAITYQQADGPALYLNGEFVAQGKRGWLGYATSFDNYHFGAGIGKGGSIGEYFDGSIDDFALFDRPFEPTVIAALFKGEETPDPAIAFNDFENVNHRDLALFTESDRDEKYLDEGQRLYEVNCTSCHSKDGTSPPLNPLSRMFTKHEMENGGDPFGMFQTITYGFRNMMPSPQLNPEERYKVIHFIRERMIREHAPELYVPVNPNYTDTMPDNPEGSGEEAARVLNLARSGYLRDFGKALISPVQGKSKDNSSLNALTIDLGNETTISYDLGTMRSIGIWRGGFLNFENTLHHKLRAPALPSSRSFELMEGSDEWHWSWSGKAENIPPDIAPLTVWPEDQLRYLGHYPHGDEIAIAYTVQGRRVLESPAARVDGDRVVIHRRLTISPGENAIEAIILDSDSGEPQIDGNTVEIDGQFARLNYRGESPRWRKSGEGDLALHIPPSAQPIHLDVALSETRDIPETDLVDLDEWTRENSPRWSQTHTLKGKLSVSAFQGYALDSIPVPLKNAYNTWMRTSCLAFFPDGRLAVGTLSGDIWMVSGIDDELEEVTWKRFAAGLYEPMGMKVVDGVLTVGTRGRIVKLHDSNGDGEADFYEAFFNEPEPAPGWHAYNFDLEVGDDGSFYYARVGGFSIWSVPGGMVRVSSDGKSWDVIGAGMRVPNGIGLLPDGRLTFGDNQGTFVPASKISITRKGDFHGAGKWPDREGDYNPENIVQPMIYMPQELDSSSGSQLWVSEDKRFGPLGNRFFHTSYGRAKTIYLMLDELADGTTQAAAFSLPLTMESGTMRIAKSPVDGQLYTSGLTGWQAGATREGSIQRIRYTGQDGIYLVDARAREGRLELEFNEPVDPGSIRIDQWKAEAWNYRWSKSYGSPHLKVTQPDVVGTDLWSIAEVDMADEGRKMVLRVPDLQTCHTLKLDFDVAGQRANTRLNGPVYFTIHQLPE